MPTQRLRVLISALTIPLAIPLAWAQAQQPASAASAPTQFPQIPLQRDPAVNGSAGESAVWTAVFLAALAAGGFLLVRRKKGAGLRSLKWLRAAGTPPMPVALGRMPLTAQASLHVVEWHGEELLLGCTAQSVSVLARHPIAGSAKESA